MPHWLRLDLYSVAGIKIIEGIGSVLRKNSGCRENYQNYDKGDSTFHWDASAGLVAGLEDFPLSRANRYYQSVKDLPTILIVGHQRDVKNLALTAVVSWRPRF